MPKFRDLVKNILYEDVEEEEEIEEPVEQPKKPARKTANRQNTRTQAAPKAAQTSVEPVQPVFEAETIVAREPAKTTLFGELSMDSVALPDGSAPAAKPAAKKSYLETRRTQSVEYQAVLSPIFGNMDEDEKDISSVHDAITLAKPNEDFELVRVISPIYGTQVQKPVSKPAAAPVATPVEEEPEEVETIDLKTFLAKKPGKTS